MKIVWVASPPQLRGLFDTDGDRHTEAGHSVERVAGDFRVGLLIGQTPGMKAPADDGLVSIHRGLHQAPPAISGTTLPSDAAVCSDRTKMIIALRRAGLTQNGCRPRRDDHARRGMSLQYFIIDRVAVVGSIGCHRTDRALDLVQQIREVRNVADIIQGQFAVESSRLLAAEAMGLGYVSRPASQARRHLCR